MASSRIINYDKDKKMIHYYYEHHKTKERVDVEEDIFEFMKKLIVHIPESQFKMIRYYSIYATCNHHHKDEVKRKLVFKNACHLKKISYRQDLIDTFDTDPLLCECGHYMEYIDFWLPPSKRKGELNYDET